MTPKEIKRAEAGMELLIMLSKMMPGILDKMDKDTYIKFVIGVASTDVEYAQKLVDKGTERFGLPFLLEMGAATSARLKVMKELLKEAELEKAKQN